ncbi:MAG: hypothetical protein UT24_C0046G0004 [Candidatus Woesebacteria bacterium GW2011_GWB1_39_12]|uniref:Uncharacterized protein n=1 Tax=Candidatus Woesebacteria bacterium GW2011_GWB1_39_12 TaxID=1618574 RepID=A0A0G0M2P7_9BACT|nr:MAG: hypothetical protein UT24_C0046G0004 [Candidatus Woesebacteria bacterium GW2011_GWB1_39_12]
MKLKSLLKENNLGQLPSDKLFKFNKATGKFNKPISEAFSKMQVATVIGAIVGVETFIHHLYTDNNLKHTLPGLLARISTKADSYINELKELQKKLK